MKSTTYPGEMNRRLAISMGNALNLIHKTELQNKLKAKRDDEGPALPLPSGSSSGVSVAPMPTPFRLRSRQAIEQEAKRFRKRNVTKSEAADSAYGGMRNPSHAVVQQRSFDKSFALRALTENFLREKPHIIDDVLDALGKPKGSFNYDAPWIAELRTLWCRQLEVEDAGPVDNDLYSTPLHYLIIRAWADLTGDPAAEAVEWLNSGAPGGIEMPIPDFGLYPHRDDPLALSVKELEAMNLNFDNYQSLTEYANANEVIEKFTDPKKKWIKVCASRDEATEFLGAEPIFNPLGLVLKDIINEEGTITGVKERLILDARRARTK